MNRSEPDNTRRFILAALFISIISVFLGLGNLLVSFLLPPKKKNSYGTKIETGLLSDLPAKNTAPKLIPEGRLWLVHAENGLTALHSSCSHLDCKFNWDEQKKLFICPCHGSEFSVTGKVLKGPAERDLDTFPLELVDEDGTTIRQSEHGETSIEIADLIKEVKEMDNNGAALHIVVDTGQKIETKKPVQI